MQLDVRTIMLMFTACLAVFTIAFALVVHRYPQLSGAKWWFISSLTITAGLLAIGLGNLVPDGLSIIAAASLLYVSLCCFWLGLRAFFKVRIYGLPAAVIVLLGVGAQSLFIYVWPSVAARQMLFSTLNIVFFSLALRELMRHRRPAIVTECHAIAAFLLAAVLLNLVRIIVIGVLPRPIDHMSAGLGEGLYLFISFTLEIGLLLTLLTLISRQLDEKRKQSDDALIESEAHFRRLAEGVSDVIWKLDRDHRLTYIGPSDERLRGYRADEVIGHHFSELLTEEGIATFSEIIRQMPAAKQAGSQAYSKTFVVQQRCRDGRWIWLEIVCTPEFDAQGTINGYHGISRDITERRRSVEALMESEMKLRAVAQWKEEQRERQSRFIDMLTHELRASLTVVRLATSSLFKQLSERAPESLPRLVNIGLTVDGMNSLVDRCIKAEMIEQGEQAVDVTSCSLPAALAEVIRDEAHENNSIGRFAVRLNAVDVIQADPQLLRVILSNLVNNAIKYSPADSIIEVEASCCERDSRSGLEVVVRNQVAAGELPDAAQIFTRFYRSQKGSSHGGTGLGLYIVNALSRMHGGHARFKASADGLGLSIGVWLPEPLADNKAMNLERS